MAYAMVLPTRVRVSAQRKRAQRARVAVFGDGYSQATADGINTFMDEWQNVGWDFLNTTDAATARAMLDAVGTTDYITWTPNTESVQKKYRVTADGYMETYHPGNLVSITFNLKQIP